MTASIIERKLRKLGKFDGAKVCTVNDVITEWNVPGVPQPSVSDLAAWTTEIQGDDVTEGNAKRGRKRQFLDSLATLTGLSRKQVLQCFNEIVKDGNDD